MNDGQGQPTRLRPDEDKWVDNGEQRRPVLERFRSTADTSVGHSSDAAPGMEFQLLATTPGSTTSTSQRSGHDRLPGDHQRRSTITEFLLSQPASRIEWHRWSRMASSLGIEWPGWRAAHKGTGRPTWPDDGMGADPRWQWRLERSRGSHDRKKMA